MPNQPRTVSTRPVSGASSTLKVMPTATVLTSTGKKTSERRTPRTRMRGGEQDREEQAEHDLQPAGDHRVDQSVAQRPLRSACSEKNWRKLSSPMNVESKRVQRVRVKQNDITVGTTKMTA